MLKLCVRLRRPRVCVSIPVQSIHARNKHISSSSSSCSSASSSCSSSSSSISSTSASHPITPQETPRKRIIIGITGATGSIYAIHLLQTLRTLNIETHLIISKWALSTLKYETGLSESAVHALAHTSYTPRDMSAAIASGSFPHDGMIIVPCSMKTLAAVRTGFCDELIARGADVTLKEGRRLVLVVRETPLNDVHLENMLALRRAGAVIFPPVPAFYTRPEGIGDIVEQSVGRMLDSLGIAAEGFPRWRGFEWRGPK